jgi:hypothetical protein
MLWNGNECGKTKVMGISNVPSPLQVIINQKQRKNVEYFRYFGSMITNGEKCTREIKSRIDLTKSALNRKTNLFTSKLNLRKELANATFGV